MSPSGSGLDQSGRSALEQAFSFARRGQAHYNRGAAALSQWLRRHLLRQGDAEVYQSESGRSLRRFFAARHVRERQEVYRRGGGGRSSAAKHARGRVVRALDDTE